MASASRDRLLTSLVGILPLWLLLVSTALAVLARNAEEFRPGIELFRANSALLALSALVWVAAVWSMRSWEGLVRIAAGLSVAVLVYTHALARTRAEGQQSLWFVVAILSVPIVALLARAASASVLRQFLMLCLALTVAWDAVALARLQSNARAAGVRDSTLEATSDRPNIYHFVFDGLQADVLADVASSSLASTFRGFTWFRNTTPTTADTINALAEVFAAEDADRSLWTRPGWDLLRDRFYQAAHTGPASLKQRLGQAGYVRTAHLYYSKQYPYFADGFDVVVPHIAYVEGHTVPLDDAPLFFNLWKLSILPPPLKHRFVSNIADQRLTGRATLSVFPSLVSYGALQKFIGEEYRKPARGRYVFFHLVFPHKPFIFASTCETTHAAVDWGDTPDDGAIRGQYLCAERTIRELLDSLRRLDRFDQSLIVIQSDHGDGLRKDGAGRYARVVDVNVPETFTRASLFVKEPGRSGDAPLQISEVPAKVSDAGRTVLARVDADAASGMKGVDLLSAPDLSGRERFFYWETETGTFRFTLDPTGRVIARTDLPKGFR